MRKFILSVLCLTGVLFCSAAETPFRAVVYDKINRQPIAKAQVKLQDLNSLREYKQTTSDSGFADFKLASVTRYRLEVTTKDDSTGTGYLAYTYMLSEKDVVSKKTFVIELEKVKHAESGLAPAMHFDYNSANLNNENLSALDNVWKMLAAFPNMQIEIGVYADCRENDLLVTKRATAIRDYLAGKGNKTNAVVKEYGNIRPLNQCSCVLKEMVCTEEKYKENRRAEFKVTAF